MIVYVVMCTPYINIISLYIVISLYRPYIDHYKIIFLASICLNDNHSTSFRNPSGRSCSTTPQGPMRGATCWEVRAWINVGWVGRRRSMEFNGIE